MVRVYYIFPINTFDTYALNDFVRPKIITVSMTLNFDIPIIPSIWFP